jgi:hypothetical protein
MTSETLRLEMGYLPLGKREQISRKIRNLCQEQATSPLFTTAAAPLNDHRYDYPPDVNVASGAVGNVVGIEKDQPATERLDGTLHTIAPPAYDECS